MRTWEVVELPSSGPRSSVSTSKKSYWLMRPIESLKSAMNAEIASVIAFVSRVTVTVTGVVLAETRSMVRPETTSSSVLVLRVIRVAFAGSSEPKKTLASRLSRC